jgi:hypothetical protein
MTQHYAVPRFVHRATVAFARVWDDVLDIDRAEFCQRQKTVSEKYLGRNRKAHKAALGRVGRVAVAWNNAAATLRQAAAARPANQTVAEALAQRRGRWADSVTAAADGAGAAAPAAAIRTTTVGRPSFPTPRRGGLAITTTTTTTTAAAELAPETVHAMRHWTELSPTVHLLEAATAAVRNAPKPGPTPVSVATGSETTRKRTCNKPKGTGGRHTSPSAPPSRRRQRNDGEASSPPSQGQAAASAKGGARTRGHRTERDK